MKHEFGVSYTYSLGLSLVKVELFLTQFHFNFYFRSHFFSCPRIFSIVKNVLFCIYRVFFLVLNHSSLTWNEGKKRLYLSHETSFTVDVSLVSLGLDPSSLLTFWCVFILSLTLSSSAWLKHKDPFQGLDLLKHSLFLPSLSLL